MQEYMSVQNTALTSLSSIKFHEKTVINYESVQYFKRNGGMLTVAPEARNNDVCVLWWTGSIKNNLHSP